MKHAGIVVGLALCTLPARGAQEVLAPSVQYALTPIDSLPTRQELETVFANQDPVLRLSQIAQDPTADFGVRLRAIRALPQFCPLTSCNNTMLHDTLVALIGSVAPGDRGGQTLLMLRAAVEALGVAKSGDPNDVSLLVPLLDNPSRDIRAATARAMRDLCDGAAIPPLRARYQNEPLEQVRLAISAALRDLGQCSP